jgi:tetratricopeptide (TPR) repeat protein
MNFIAILSRVRKPLFPHISRIFSAPIVQRGTKILFWMVCIAFFIVGIITSQYIPQSYDEYRKALLERPFSIDSYIRLGRALYTQGNGVAAVKQITVAQSTIAANVLGAQSELQNVLSEWDYASGAKERSYAYWKQIISTYPEYRDGYIQLAQASYDLKRYEEAKTYLVQAQTLDPNNALISQIQKEMGL